VDNYFQLLQDHSDLLQDHGEQIAVLQIEMKATKTELAESKMRERDLEKAINHHNVTLAQWGVILSALVFVAGTVTTLAVRSSYESVKAAIISENANRNSRPQ
jgi:hypothetical protein